MGEVVLTGLAVVPTVVAKADVAEVVSCTVVAAAAEAVVDPITEITTMEIAVEVPTAQNMPANRGRIQHGRPHRRHPLLHNTSSPTKATKRRIRL